MTAPAAGTSAVKTVATTAEEALKEAGKLRRAGRAVLSSTKVLVSAPVRAALGAALEILSFIDALEMVSSRLETGAWFDAQIKQARALSSDVADVVKAYGEFHEELLHMMWEAHTLEAQTGGLGYGMVELSNFCRDAFPAISEHAAEAAQLLRYLDSAYQDAEQKLDSAKSLLENQSFWLTAGMTGNDPAIMKLYGVTQDFPTISWWLSGALSNLRPHVEMVNDDLAWMRVSMISPGWAGVVP
jgi:hypothetical protein